jgi:hypothetical protein
MTQCQPTLNYARSAPPRYARVLGFSASAALLLPLLIAVAMYGAWFAAWYVLGHPPRPLVDDPKYAGSDLMRLIAGVAMLGALPAAGASLALNVLHVATSRPTRAAARLILLLASWLALLALFLWDPGQVFAWYFD